MQRRRMPPDCVAHQLLEALEHRYRGRSFIDIRHCAEACQIDESDGRHRGLEAVDRARVRIRT